MIMPAIPFFLCLIFLSLNTLAQQCDPSRPLSTPNENFFINDDGTVTDIENGLTWMRCAIGQQWTGKACSGKAKTFTWKEAFHQEDKINQGAGYGGLNNWHIPSLPELASIVERQCNNPRINTDIFPATPAAAFWTANHKKGGNQKAFAMDFNEEGLKIISQYKLAYIRLVSGR